MWQREGERWQRERERWQRERERWQRERDSERGVRVGRKEGGQGRGYL
jgi:hypothetical protein